MALNGMRRFNAALTSFLILSGVLGVASCRRSTDSEGASPAGGAGEGGIQRSRLESSETRTVVPALVRKIVDPALHRERRLEAIRNLPDELTEEELDGLAAVLREPVPASMSPGDWYVALNEIMRVLARDRLDWDGYGGAIHDLMVDRNVDPVIRDYASQFLALWLRPTAGNVADPAQRQEWMSGYASILTGSREAFEPVFGTSLMMLCDLRDNGVSEDLDGLRPVIEETLPGVIDGTTGASLANRISAIQAAGRLKIGSALEVIRTFARDASTDPSLRLSSIAALGYFGQPEDRPFLEELVRGDSRLRFAARSALEKIE